MSVCQISVPHASSQPLETESLRHAGCGSPIHGLRFGQCIDLHSGPASMVLHSMGWHRHGMKSHGLCLPLHVDCREWHSSHGNMSRSTSTSPWSQSLAGSGVAQPVHELAPQPVHGFAHRAGQRGLAQHGFANERHEAALIVHGFAHGLREVARFSQLHVS